jgi:hypothetical protein
MTRYSIYSTLVAALVAAAPAPGRSADAGDSNCTPKVTFEWLGSTVVKMWTDATFDSEKALAPDAELKVLKAVYALPDGGTPEEKETGEKEAEKTPRTRTSYLGPIVVVPVKDGFTQPVWRADRPIRVVSNAIYASRDGGGGSTFLLDVGDSRLLERGGRVTVVLRNVKCGDKTKTVQFADAVILEQHHIAVDVGAAFSLDAKGSMPAHPEFALTSYSRWMGYLSGAVDLRITNLEKVASDSTTNQESFLKSGGNTLDISGRVFLNVDPQLRNYGIAREGTQPWFALVGGLGARSVPGQDAVDARARFFGGIRLQVLGYNADRPAESFGNSRGHVEIGVARNWFWRDTKEGRLYSEAQLEIPNIGAKYVRFLARITVDRPMQFANTGPSEIRLSVLSSINPTLFGQILGFSSKASSL